MTTGVRFGADEHAAARGNNVMAAKRRAVRLSIRALRTRALQPQARIVFRPLNSRGSGSFKWADAGRRVGYMQRAGSILVTADAVGLGRSVDATT